MFFRSYSKETELVLSKFNIPIPKNGKKVSPDIIICPLLSFDDSGSRLGYGGGYYDRTLCSIKKKKKVIFLGLAFSKQKSFIKLPINKYDQKLDGLISEKGVLIFK